MFKLENSPATGGHVIGSVCGTEPGPTLLIVCGIHGNEPAGVQAARRALALLKERQPVVRGEIVLLIGNTRALARKVRYLDTDLNRAWTADNVRAIRSGATPDNLNAESREQQELFAEVESALARARGEAFFLDLHTTSAPGKPFATVGDTLRNRRFASNFPVTIVLGLEEQIDGTLLEYMNNRGAITIGLESGQHDASSSIDYHEAAIWIANVASGNLRRSDVPGLDRYRSLLTGAGGGRRVIEVRHRHSISPEDEFRMEPGFTNFAPVRRGQILARDRRGEIAAPEAGVIVLPLYQAQGDEGFFLGREVKKFWLSLSALTRRLRLGDYVHLLPGVNRDPDNENLFTVNTRIARILPLQVFHLLGFRKRRWVGRSLYVSRRAFDLKGPNAV